MREEYEAKKWAFVSDYARFWILYKYGGLYFDTDVEVIKDMSDIVERGAFMGCEPVQSGSPNIAPGLGLYKEILDNYEHDNFILPDSGEPETVVERVTKILALHGFEQSYEIQIVYDVDIYPPEYFCPMNYNTGIITLTDNTRSIHHYTASWLNETGKKIVSINPKYASKGKSGCLAEKIQTFPLRVKNKLERLGFAGTVRFAVKKIFGRV